MTRTDRRHDRWSGYLDRFHDERPGITEQVLERCADGAGLAPYDWMNEPFAGADHEVSDTSWSSVVDVGCGSGPLQPRVLGWVGIDRSSAELAAARAAERGPLVLGDATALPFRDGAVERTIAPMVLQIVDDLDAALAELGRVTQRDGRCIVMVPTGGRLPALQVLAYARLTWTLRNRIGYPNDADLEPTPLRISAARAGWQIVGDVRRVFGYPVDGRASADLLVRSLYLPGADSGRVTDAVDLVAGWDGRRLAVPLRRIVLRRRAQPSG